MEAAANELYGEKGKYEITVSKGRANKLKPFQEEMRKTGEKTK